MEAVGEKRFARPIRNLLNLSTDDEKLISDLDKILNRRVVKRLNQALASDISIVERDLDKLYENLVGRSFSPEQLEKIFTEWLKGSSGISKKTYIKVFSQEEKTEDQSENKEEKEVFISYLQKYYPELLTLIDKADVDGMSLLLSLLSWEQSFSLKREDSEEILREFLTKKAESLLEQLENDKSIVKSLEELTNKIFDDDKKEEVELKEIIRENINVYLEEDNLQEYLYDKIELKSIKDWLLVLKKEAVSLKFLRYLLIKFLRFVENSNLEKIEPEDFEEEFTGLFEKDNEILEMAVVI